MSTKTRPARKVRAGDVIDLGGQPFEACFDAAEFEPGMTVLVGHAAGEAECHSTIRLASDAPLNVQRAKAPKKGTDADPEPSGAPIPGQIYTLGPFPGPMPSVEQINAALAKAITALMDEISQ